MVTNFSVELTRLYLEESKANNELNNKLLAFDILYESFSNELFFEGKFTDAYDKVTDIAKKGADKAAEKKANIVNKVTSSAPYKAVESSKLFQLVSTTKDLVTRTIERFVKYLASKLDKFNHMFMNKLDEIKQKKVKSGKDLTKKQQMIFKVMGTSAEILTRYIGAVKYNTSVRGLISELDDPNNSMGFKIYTASKGIPAIAGPLPGPNVVLYLAIPVYSLIDVIQSYIRFFNGQTKLANKLDELFNAVKNKPELSKEHAEAGSKICNNMKRIIQIANNEANVVSKSLDDAIAGRFVDDNGKEINTTNNQQQSNTANNARPATAPQQQTNANTQQPTK